MRKAFFSTGVSALFEMATADADCILPAHLRPIEPRPERSILCVSAFHFSDSPAGAHAQLIFSVIVPPMLPAKIPCVAASKVAAALKGIPGLSGLGVPDWARFPKAGFFPFLAATTSEASRAYLEETRCMPTWSGDLDAQFIERADRIRIVMRSQGKPVVDFTVTEHLWQDSTHLLQTHMIDGDRRLKADMQISGSYTMHEREEGTMTLFEHPMTDSLTLDEVSQYPFREHWLKQGCEIVHPLEAL